MNKKFVLCMIVISAVLTGSAFAVSSYGKYPAPQDAFMEVLRLQEEYPGYVTVGELGKSANKRTIRYARIAKPGAEGLPQALIVADIHGNEWIGNRVAMSMMWRLLRDRGSDEWVASLLDRMEFWIIPVMNPDGYMKTWEERGNKSAQWAHMRKNANGVDLNRNFPLPAERTVDMDMAGSTDPDHIRYMGPHPYSEPETQLVRDFVESHSFFAAIDFHSNWGTLFPPKCNGPSCEKQFKKMLEPARARQVHVKYPIVMQWQVDSFSGEMEDALFYDYGIMAVCWEVYPETMAKEQHAKPGFEHPFWSMNPDDIDYWIENDRDAALAAIEAAYNLTGGKPVPEKYRQVRLK
ncbi:MAG TPA: M14 family metallopeptidase [bacterium]|nr:M14 family metallopeptidase [bacterium]